MGAAAFGIVTDLVEAGYVVKEKDGRRNDRQAPLPLAPLPPAQIQAARTRSPARRTNV